MKPAIVLRIPLVMAALLLIAGGALRVSAQNFPPSLHFVQWTAGDAGAAVSDTTHFGKHVTTGNVILVLAHWNNQDVTATVSDSRGNQYIPLSGPLDSGPTERFQAWYAKNIKGNSELGVTINFSGKTKSFSVIDAMEYAGFDKESPLLGAATATGKGQSQKSGIVAGDTPHGCVLIGLFGYSNYALPYQAGEGFTLQAYEASTMIEEADCSKVKTPAATATSSNAADWAAIAAAFRTAPQKDAPAHK